ncbi:unnamed protein product, partial [Porites evermanni]
LPNQGSSRPQQQHQRTRQVQTSLTPCPFKKWSVYFPDIVYNPESSLGTKAEAIMKFVEKHAAQLSKDEIESRGAVVFDYTDLLSDPELMGDFPSLAVDLRDEPTIVLQTLGLAVSQILLTAETGESQQVACLVDLPYIQARITNFEPVTQLKSLKSNYFGKFVAIRGTAVRVSNVKPLVTNMAFSCNLCGEIQVQCILVRFQKSKFLTKSLTKTSMTWQGCQLSQIIRETPDFKPFLPVSRLESEISRIIAEACHFLSNVTIKTTSFLCVFFFQKMTSYLHYLLHVYQKCFSSTLSNLVLYYSYSIPCVQVYCTAYVNTNPANELDKLSHWQSVKLNFVSEISRVYTVIEHHTHNQFVSEGIFFLFTQAISLTDGKYAVPTKCSSVDCRGRSFTPERSSPLTKTIDWQTVRVQEIMDDDQRESGRIPRTVECELTADLVDSCVPGDMVTITGVAKVTTSEENRNRNNKDKCMFLLYIHANAVNNNKGNTSSGEQTSGLSMEFSIKELYAIQEIQAQDNLFRLIVGSLCPSIYGHELVKAGLVLGLFGGTQRYLNDKNRIPVRGNPHILVVGDPGLGKSQMLQAVSNVAPRGVYVCGNATSTSGLTVTLSKEGSSGDYSLEAGALVLGDQGCCCIDEFDKMGSQHQALLEAMEQQSISIAKAGIVCSLPARTSILAAANPVGGHYNKAKTVSENLKMGSALLSRFDLVFILLDKPDEEMDSMLSEHVMALHAGKKSAFGVATARRRSREDSGSDEDETKKQWEAGKPLSERLKIGRNEEFDAIPAQLLRKYVGYARTYVHPKLTPAAAEVLQNFYLDLRRQHHSADSTPITTRQLESLIRLTQARARLEMREKASQQDAQDVVEIMKYSLLDTFSDDFGNLDFQRSQHGSGMSSRAQVGLLLLRRELNSRPRDYHSSTLTSLLLRNLKELRLQIRSFDDFVYSLNNQGFLLKKGPRVYQLQTSSCL